MHNRVYLKVEHNTDTSICGRKILFYSSVWELIIVNLVYAYMNRDSTGTIFSEHGGIRIGGQCFENVLQRYDSDLRYSGLLQFVLFSMHLGIDTESIANKIGKNIGVNITFQDEAEADGLLESLSWDYSVMAVMDITVSGDVMPAQVEELSAISLIVASALGTTCGIYLFGYYDYRMLMQKLNSAEVDSYNKFSSIATVFSKVRDKANDEEEFVQRLELCLVEELINIGENILFVNDKRFWQLILHSALVGEYNVRQIFNM
ncbi:hypothetical protein AALB53_08205 [Lachnospiraceae bacterium 47-T17]